MSAPAIQRFGGTLVGALIICVPLVLAAAYFTGFASAGMQRTYALFLINLIAVLGLGIFSGNSGILSFGHVAFIGIGAYVSAILTLPLATKATALPNLPDFLATRRMGSCPGAPRDAHRRRRWSARSSACRSSRMGGAAAVIATLGLLLIVHGIIIGAQRLHPRQQRLPRRAAHDRHLDRARRRRSAQCSSRAAFRDSRRRRSLRASREDEIAARAIGIDVVRRRLLAWTLERRDLPPPSGVLLAHFLGAFSPSKFYFDDTLTLAHHADRRRHDDGLRRIRRRRRCDPDHRDSSAVSKAAIDIFGWETPEVFGLTAGRPLRADPARHVPAPGRHLRAAGARRGRGSPPV